MIRSIALTLILWSAFGYRALAQYNWQLRKNEDGIKVYTSSTPNSNFKAIKVECPIKASQSQLVAFLLDIAKQSEWVYGTKKSEVMQILHPNELIFYSEISVPWPCTNRDYIAHFTVTQVSPQLLTIDSHAEPGLQPPKAGLVRVQKSMAHWEVTTTSTGLFVVYTLQFDPGGSVPAWLINMFVTKGPLQTFSNLREQVMKPQYQNAHFDFIK